MNAPADDDVTALLRTVAERELLPRFRDASRSDAREKSPGEIVTDADLAAETALVHGLSRLFPDAIVVAEEASHGDPAALDGLAHRGDVLLVDPLDGTAHFAAGEPPFGIMVARVRCGTTTSAWIHLAHSGRTLVAHRGAGATLDGAPVRVPAVSGELRGAVLSGFLPARLRADAEAARASLIRDGSHRCAAQRALDVVTGTEHFALYYRTLPWDHAAPCLVIEEAGGLARRYGGRRYAPFDEEGEGLLVAADAATWRAVHARLLPSVPIVEARV